MKEIICTYIFPALIGLVAALIVICSNPKMSKILSDLLGLEK